MRPKDVQTVEEMIAENFTFFIENSRLPSIQYMDFVNRTDKK